MQFIGIDLGSSSIKVAVVDGETQSTVAVRRFPEQEMEIQAPEPLWAEQDPELWWKSMQSAIHLVLQEPGVHAQDIAAIGIGYQMHGLVLCGRDGEVLRPSIIWCDSRAVSYGNQGYASLGSSYCRKHLLNSPGNFTASKMKWVIENEPHIADQAKFLFLPGDYLAFRMTGTPSTTISGLSEGIMWDFSTHTIAHDLLSLYGIGDSLIPAIVPNTGMQGVLTSYAAAELGLPAGIPITYRAGDQPNNAVSLGVLNPGEVAATGGTSGVVYGVVDQNTTDPSFRVNTFAHVNHSEAIKRLGVLLCINGTGIQYNWLRQHMGGSQFSYDQLEHKASVISTGAEGLSLFPFGNGAERMLDNQVLGAAWHGLDFNRHGLGHVIRAGLEGIAFSFIYGMEIMKAMGVSVAHIRVGNDNLFRSSIFSNTVAQAMSSTIEVVETTGAVGAALAAGYGLGYYSSLEEATQKRKSVLMFSPKGMNTEVLATYQHWKSLLDKQLAHT